ncbi:MAG: VTT domain-containing protein [Candidatus Bathyarchaeota archaeon]|nr:VTT domain-containing protein [Candidatus Bathyarchaeota archaeon]
MASLIDFALVFLISLGVNMIPFAGPSNLLIPTWFAPLLVHADITTKVAVGVLVALGAALAKGSHYMITFFISGKLSEKRRKRLDADAAKVKRWAFPLLFIAAASPIPDEPIVIPLGLMKYSPAKFFTAYFLGKVLIAVAGAFVGGFAVDMLSSWISPELMIVISVALTVIITIILLKFDMGELAEKILHRKPKGKGEQENTNNPAENAHKEDDSCPQNNADTP